MKGGSSGRCRRRGSAPPLGMVRDGALFLADCRPSPAVWRRSRKVATRQGGSYLGVTVGEPAGAPCVPVWPSNPVWGDSSSPDRLAPGLWPGSAWWAVVPPHDGSQADAARAADPPCAARAALPHLAPPLRRLIRQRGRPSGAPLTPRPVPHRPAARRRVAEHRHVPRRATTHPLPGSQGGRAVAQHPRHCDQTWSPLVPVLAPLRVTPPRRTPHAHDTIRTRIRLAAQRPALPMIRGRGRCGVPWPHRQQAPRPGTSSVRARLAAHRDTRRAALDSAARLARGRRDGWVPLGGQPPDTGRLRLIPGHCRPLQSRWTTNAFDPNAAPAVVVSAPTRE